MSVRLRARFVIACAVAAGCNALNGSGDLAIDDGACATCDGGGAGDAGSPMAPPPNGDGAVPPGPPGTDGGPVTYGALGDKASWTGFDLGALALATRGYDGAGFDGRYVYFAPFMATGSVPHGLALRYDTHAPWAATTSWSSADLASADNRATGFRGVVWDGKYVYFAPAYVNAVGTVVRYDPALPFAPSSMNVFLTSTLHQGATGFFGGVFDGRYVYFVPDPSSSLAVRYDTTGKFGEAVSWEYYDLNAQFASPGFHGGVFDGRYVYFVPYADKGVVVRFDTKGAFTAPASWTTFDVSTLPNSALARGFVGASFDGRYVVLAPWQHTIAVRYDTQAAFAEATSWTSYDLGSGRFRGAVFDGAHVVLVPNTGGSPNPIARLDVTAPFSAATSWSTSDIAALGYPSAYSGAAFDGRYMYLAPIDQGLALRFDARSPSALPPVPPSFY